jgi:hypothetical protein
VAEVLLVVGILLFIALHPVHSCLRMAFAVSEQDVALRGLDANIEDFHEGLTSARSASYMSGTRKVALVCLIRRLAQWILWRICDEPTGPLVPFYVLY